MRDEPELEDLVGRLIGADPELDWHQIVDAVWIASRTLPPSSSDDGGSSHSVKDSKQGQEVIGRDGDGDETPPLPPPPAPDQYPQDEQTLEKERTDAFIQPSSRKSTVFQNPAQTVSASSIESPTGWALPNPRLIERALKPLKRRIASRTESRLDEEVTAQETAEQSRPNKLTVIPVFHPVQVPWLEAVLLVDTSSSMLIWQETADELTQVLSRLGFRGVQVWHLETESYLEPESKEIQIRATTGKRHTVSPERFLKERKNCLLLILTDCVAPAWQEDRLIQLLARLAKQISVTILQVFPEHLWDRTVLRHIDIGVTAYEPVTSNTHFKIERLSSLFFEESEEKTNSNQESIPIPVVALEPEFLEDWAKMLVGASYIYIPSIYTTSLKSDRSYENDDDEPKASKTLDPLKLVRSFLSFASPPAQKLAALLASVPLTLPVIRLIQTSFFKDQTQLVHLAEVITSGLVYLLPETPTRIAKNQEIFDFHEGVRDLLRRTIHTSETKRVWDIVDGFIRQKAGRGKGFAGLIPNVRGIETLQLDEQTLPFARLKAETLAALGPAYRPVVQRLQQQITQFEDKERDGGLGSNPNGTLEISQPINDPFIEPFGGGTGIRFTVRNLKLNGEGNMLALEQGGRVEATLEINHDCAECGGAINQIIVGLAEEERAQACVWIGESSSDGWQTVSFSLNIPAKPGVYYIRTRYAQAYNAEDSLHWWTIDRPNGPTEESNIGAVGVQGVEDRPEFPYQLYRVENQWGQSEGDWMFGARSNQENIATIKIRSDDDGQTLNGTVTYSSGEENIDFHATSVGTSNYIVVKKKQEQQDGEAELWVIGGREAKDLIVKLDAGSDDDGQTLNGTMTYAGEGLRRFTATRISPSKVKDLKTAFFRVIGETCPVFSTLVTYQEAMANKTLLSTKLDTWDIAKLADGGSMDGPGHRSKIRANDDRSFGHALCRTLDLTANPDNTDTPPLLTFEFDVVEFVEEANSSPTFEIPGNNTSTP